MCTTRSAIAVVTPRRAHIIDFFIVKLCIVVVAKTVGTIGTKLNTFSAGGWD